MPAIAGAEEVVANAGRLLAAAEELHVPVLSTEQNPKGLGSTVPELARPDDPHPVVAKMTFDSCRAPAVMEGLQPGHHVVLACAPRTRRPPSAASNGPGPRSSPPKW